MLTRKVAVCGITLCASPARKAPTVMTAVCKGATLRATMLCKPITMAAPATTGSAACWGMAPWPPTPSSVIVMVSLEAMVGPSRSISRPVR